MKGVCAALLKWLLKCVFAGVLYWPKMVSNIVIIILGFETCKWSLLYGDTHLYYVVQLISSCKKLERCESMSQSFCKTQTFQLWVLVERLADYVIVEK